MSSTKTPVPGSGQSAQVTTNLFDTMRRIWKTTLPDNTSVTNEFFATGLLKKSSGSRTYPVEYTYDFAGRMKTMKTWQGFAANSGAAITTWNYNPYRGWLDNKRYDDNTGPNYTYTAAGRLATRTWARTVSGSPLVTTYSYNNAGDMSGVDYSDTTADVTYGYDRRGRQTSVAQSGGTTTALKYDDLGSLLSETYSGGPLNGLILSNRFDTLARRTNVSVLNASSTILASTTYGYDDASRLLNVTALDSGLSPLDSVRYSYLANSPLVTNIWFTNNSTLRMTTTKKYDLLNRLTGTTSAAGGSNVAVFNYAYNSANQRTTITNVDNSRWVYQYDSLGQVISGKKYWADGTAVAGQQFEYGFDDIGNRKTTGTGGDSVGASLRLASYTNNAINQITSRSVPGFVNVLGTAKTNATVTLWGDNGAFSATSRKVEYFRGELAATNTANALWLSITNLAVLNNGTNPDIVTNTVGKTLLAKNPESFTYDLDGNQTGDSLWTSVWNGENRRVTVESVSTLPAGAKVKEVWTHLADGRWIERVVSTNNGTSYYPAFTNRYMWDKQVLLAVLDHTNGVVVSFLRGLDLSGSVQGAGGVGGVLAVKAGSSAQCGAMTNTTHFTCYDGNGNVTALVNAADGSESARTDDVIGEVKYLFRDYDVDTGRWLSRDPIGERGGRNLYEFANNDPLDFIDSDGRKTYDFKKDTYYREITFANGDILITADDTINVQSGNLWPFAAGSNLAKIQCLLGKLGFNVPAPKSGVYLGSFADPTVNAWTVSYGILGVHRVTFFKTVDINNLSTVTAQARAVTMWHEMKGHNQDNGDDGTAFDAKYEKPVNDAADKLRSKKDGCSWCSPKTGDKWAVGDAFDRAMCDCEINPRAKKK